MRNAAGQIIYDESTNPSSGWNPPEIGEVQEPDEEDHADMANEKSYFIKLSQKDLVRILRATEVAKDWALEREKESVYNKSYWAEDAKEYTELHEVILSAVRDEVNIINKLRVLKERSFLRMLRASLSSRKEK